ncbi:anti-sigma factor [Runella slithyformis]|uniref:Anti-sigma-K factor RskA n=1 Tax=Runella slithyformis (strain ATCC 29530 / DSM 19594 / LMG 11500 / NCIMB 11436 / LSU 4) TaxID=761193 RepID=A0A7U4E859_RUNSL|nr:anti-sigma factor [Runella slithyformis]AEI50909.1 Anti-sigma-K factor RskA [Runella slithyformis DSM 19594]
MIDIKAYIESGILEDYLSGNITDQERREVECLSKIYPEIKTELDQLGEAVERYAFAHRVTPPAELKSKIMVQLEFAVDKKAVSSNGSSLEGSEEDETPVYKLDSRQSSFQWGWVAAASVVALIGSAVYFNARLDTVNTALDRQSAELTQKNELIANLDNPDNQFVTLKGVEKSPNSAVRVVWNPKTQEVRLNVLSLPVPQADKQYQLWGLVGGKPVDLGVFDVNGVMQKMKAASQAEAFAVTLEKRGGSPSPTLSEMYVMGKVSG